MTCYHPMNAYKSLTKRSNNGKAYITFRLSDAGLRYENIKLPCGKCIGCRLRKSKEWALRCVHEASLFKNNCFITLTFNDKHLNPAGSLVKSDYQKFMKRLRKKYHGIESVRQSNNNVSYPIRYFHCGEYGSKLSRPHHHACLFNFDFDDKILWDTREGVKLYRSAKLEELWPFGFSTIGDVTWDSAAYVARYVTKKITGEMAAQYYLRGVDYETGEIDVDQWYYIEPEYITMSRRPGIGKRWYEQFKTDVYPKDYVTHHGKKFKSPAYYDKLFDVDYPEAMEVVKERRINRAAADAANNTPRRLVAREECQKAKAKRLVRRFENDS